jgi:MFS family permease
MIKSFIYELLKRRHFWRYATFDDIAELYMSRTLRVAAVYIGAGFTSVFLFEQGYSLIFIMSFWALFYLFKAFVSPLVGLLVARFGAAFGTLISNLLYVPAMLALGFVPQLGLPILILSAFFMGLSGTLYEVCYFFEFSKVKSTVNAGKEIGFMNIIEKVTISLSPVIGGLIALLFGVQVTMWLAGLLFALAAIPLFKINDKPEKYQRITVRGFPWRMAIPSMIARSAVGFDIVASSVVWGLFVAIMIFPSAGNDIYVIIGALSSVTIVVAIAASISFGKIIDREKGGNLLKIGVGANALVHLSRIFASTPFGVVGVNITNEVATTAQNMAFLRGMFDTADLSGHRIMYLVGVEIMSNIGAMLACIAMVICACTVGSAEGFKIFFVISAFVILFVGSARFRLYRK